MARVTRDLTRILFGLTSVSLMVAAGVAVEFITARPCLSTAN